MQIGNRLTHGIIVTGHSSGIGKAIAELFSNKRDWFVYGMSRTDYKDNCNSNIIIDLTDLEYLNDRLNDMLDVRDFNVLVNNAGSFPLKNFTIEEEDFKNYMELMDLNLHAVYFATQIFLERNKDSKIPVHVVNIASLSGITACPESIAYGMTKAGVISLTRSFAKLYPQHRVNCISPGFFKTNLVPGELPNELLCGIPLKREGKPEEIAKLVEFIVSSDYITGHNFIIDGGVML